MGRLLTSQRAISFTWGAMVLGLLLIPMLWLSLELSRYARAAGEVQKIADLSALAAARKADVLAWQQQTVKVFGPRALPEGRQIAAENSSYLGQFGIHPGVQRITLNNAQQVVGVTVAADVTPLFPALPGGRRILITREGFAQFAWR